MDYFDQEVDYEDISDQEKEIDSKEEPEIESEDDSSSDITLELGDIIEILAPTNSDLHQTTFFIDYVDETYVKLINVATLREYPLNISETGGFTDESIQEIIVHSRSKEPGYAKQNGLLPKVWINIHFGGEFPTIITGEISELIEDQIEIITYPELKTIYIDFAYKGIPKYIPLEKIVIREKPLNLKKFDTLNKIDGSEENADIEAT